MASTIPSPEALLTLGQSMNLERFLQLPRAHRVAVIPYCSVEVRREIAALAKEPSAAVAEAPEDSTPELSLLDFNKSPEILTLHRGPTGIHAVAARDLRAGEEIYTLRGPVLPYATIFTLQVTQGLHMNPYDGSEFIAHGCRPNIQVVVDELPEGPKCAIGPEGIEVANKNETQDFILTHPYVLRWITLCDIPKGASLSFNYLTTEYVMDKPFDCLCGVMKTGDVSGGGHPEGITCFGNISGFKFLSAQDRAALAPYITPVVKQAAIAEGLLSQP